LLRRNGPGIIGHSGSLGGGRQCTVGRSFQTDGFKAEEEVRDEVDGERMRLLSGIII